MNAVIIGASRGLGYSLTEKLLACGHSVAAGVRDISSLDGFKNKFSDNLLVFECDVKSEKSIIDGVKSSIAFLETIDTMCYCAGVIMPGDRENQIHESSLNDMKDTFDVNFFGAFISAKEYYKVVEKGSKILLITSEGCYTKNTGTWIPCYGLSKTAQTKLAGMFSSAVDDVEFYAVHPGRMNTDMGRTTAQIEPEETANGIYGIMTGAIDVSKEKWYINYKGEQI